MTNHTTERLSFQSAGAVRKNRPQQDPQLSVLRIRAEIARLEIELREAIRLCGND
jgi:hypothetical protein